MQTTTKYIELHVPYSMRALNPELKQRSGFFSFATKLWNLPDTEDNRAFAEALGQKLNPKPKSEDRILPIATACVALFNSLRVGQYRLTEVSPTRIVLEEVSQA